MILDTLVGKIEVTAGNTNDVVLRLVSEKRETLVSVLNGVELIGGALGEEDRIFDDEEDILHFNRFGKIVYSTILSRTEFLMYLQYEVLNFLDYKSINEMRRMRSG